MAWGRSPSSAEAVRTTDTRGRSGCRRSRCRRFWSIWRRGRCRSATGSKGRWAPVTACAASVQAIGDAARLIRKRRGRCGRVRGSEAAIDRVSLGGFAAAKALGTAFNDTPEQASRPFDAQRDGFVMGFEGAGMLVIEALDHALARGAQPLAELVGYGTSADAYHITSGPEDGDGAARSMQAALAQAGLTAQDVQHLNALRHLHRRGRPGRAGRHPPGVWCGRAGGHQLHQVGHWHLLGAAGAVAPSSPRWRCAIRWCRAR